MSFGSYHFKLILSPDNLLKPHEGKTKLAENTAKSFTWRLGKQNSNNILLFSLLFKDFNAKTTTSLSKTEALKHHNSEEKVYRCINHVELKSTKT